MSQDALAPLDSRERPSLAPSLTTPSQPSESEAYSEDGSPEVQGSCHLPTVALLSQGRARQDWGQEVPAPRPLIWYILRWELEPQEEGVK